MCFVIFYALVPTILAEHSCCPLKDGVEPTGVHDKSLQDDSLVLLAAAVFCKENIFFLSSKIAV